MDPKIQIVTAIGKAGSGKTICAIAAGLEQTIDEVKQEYTRVIVSRPVQPLGKDIGFLPGTMEEKMSPWLMPIQDNLQFLMGNDKITLDIYMQKGTIEIEALTYIRGRSISNAFIIIDEAQNLTTHELKTIITRVGEGTKIVLTGDVEQIDNVYIDATSNGLTHAVEKFKKFELASHVTLHEGRDVLRSLPSPHRICEFNMENENPDLEACRSDDHDRLKTIGCQLYWRIAWMAQEDITVDMAVQVFAAEFPEFSDGCC